MPAASKARARQLEEQASHERFEDRRRHLLDLAAAHLAAAREMAPMTARDALIEHWREDERGAARLRRTPSA